MVKAVICRTSACLTGLLVIGCATARSPVTPGEMQANVAFLQALNVSAVPGVTVATNALPRNGVRVVTLDPNPKMGVARLRRMLERPTWEDLGVRIPPFRWPARSAGNVQDLSATDQAAVWGQWRDVIRAVLSHASFDTNETALCAALDEGRVVIVYLLVARFDTAEMGSVDVVKMLVLNAQGELVARTRVDRSASYPLGFIGEKGWRHDFLF